MDILSHLYFVQDRLDEAIANQEAAVKLNNDAELTDFLRQLQQKKWSKNDSQSPEFAFTTSEQA